MNVSPWKKCRIYAIIASLTVLDCGCAETKSAATPPPSVSPSTTPSSVAPLVPVKKAADWCREHGVPESQCTRCNKDLIPEFQKKNDWCASHGLPESQCLQCDPSRAEALKALQPAESSP